MTQYIYNWAAGMADSYCPPCGESRLTVRASSREPVWLPKGKCIDHTLDSVCQRRACGCLRGGHIEFYGLHALWQVVKFKKSAIPVLEDQGMVHKQSQVNYNQLELQFKSISSNFIG